MNANRIKEIRKNKGITLKVLAKATGYTESYLSQIERALKNPSLEALRKISVALAVPIITFLVESYEHERGSLNEYKVIENEKRKKIYIPTIASYQEMITPVFGEMELDQKIQGFCMRLEKCESASEKQISHLADESILMVNGRLSVFIGEDRFELKKGDSLYIKGGTLHNYCNDYDEIAEMVVYMSVENDINNNSLSDIR
jgi:transcriptional regulator with XRE-family HTH domain